ncbi:protein quaking-like [Neolamprologus brichardi]|uniref:protein quaking-like n=1 Tax=Neolamprologus brichardi TaxID=32507 RepID=UPI0016439855|nr:protein quaking-like [Neolamprologus brichardi]
MEGKEKPRPGPDYLMQLMNDKKLMSGLPNFCGIFQHLERLLDEGQVIVQTPREQQFHLHHPSHPSHLQIQEAKEDTGMTSRTQEDQNRGKPNWEHLNEDLHVLITVEDAQNRADIKLKRAVDEVTKLLVPAESVEIIAAVWWTAAPHVVCTALSRLVTEPSSVSQQASRVLSGPAPILAPPTALRTPAPTGPTLVPLIRQIQTVLPNGTPALMAGVGPESGLIYTTPYDYPYALPAPASILEYPLDSGGVLGKPAPPCSCECSPTPHHHTHGQWSPAPTLVLRHAS